MTKRYHYLVLPVKPTRKAIEIQRILNSVANQGYRLVKIDEDGEVYRDEETGQLQVSDNYLFERESELPKMELYYPKGAKDYLERNLVYHLVKAERWDDIEKLLNIDFFKEEALKALKREQARKKADAQVPSEGDAQVLDNDISGENNE